MKKADERDWVNHFVRAWRGRGAIESIDHQDREAPDFVGALTNGNPFGLEIVSLTDADVAKIISVIERFKDELREGTRASTTPASFRINIGEDGVAQLHDRSHRRILIARLLRFARRFPRRPREMYRRKLEGRGISGIDRLAVYPMVAGEVDVGIGRSVLGQPALVYERIAEKGRKANAYRQRLAPGAEMWLLVVGGETIANSGSAPILGGEPIATPFDRVFFLDLWPVRAGEALGRVRELPTKLPDASPET